MRTQKKQEVKAVGADETMCTECWNYIQSVVEIVREPVLVLDQDLVVIVANEPFYRTFKVDDKATVGTHIYELGNGQWNIPKLRKLLGKILPKETSFKDFTVVHEFPHIGQKSMILNARIVAKKNGTKSILPPIILLSIEDVTPMMEIAATLALHVKELASKNAERTKSLETQIGSLERRLQLKSKKIAG